MLTENELQIGFRFVCKALQVDPSFITCYIYVHADKHECKLENEIGVTSLTANLITDWLSSCMSDILQDGLTNWPRDWSANWRINGLTNWWINRLTDWWTFKWLTDSRIHEPGNIQTRGLKDSPAHYSTNWRPTNESFNWQVLLIKLLFEQFCKCNFEGLFLGNLLCFKYPGTNLWRSETWYRNVHKSTSDLLW